MKKTFFRQFDAEAGRQGRMPAAHSISGEMRKKTAQKSKQGLKNWDSCARDMRFLSQPRMAASCLPALAGGMGFRLGLKVSNVEN